MKILIGAAILFFTFSCVKAQEDPVKIFGEGVPIATLIDAELNEISGLACSRTVPGLIYVHNDSGGEAAVYLLDTLGNTVGKIELLETRNRDWEDIAVGPGPGRKSYIYIGEIGDNNAVHKDISIYRIAEPTEGTLTSQSQPEKTTLTYPGGARDAESLMVDPVTGDLFVISKRDSLNTLFRLPADKFGDDGFELEEMIKLPFTSATAADISSDGSQILVKNYFAIYYWKRNPGETVVQAMRRQPLELPYSPEPQGEAIGFNPEGNVFYTLSEKRFDIDPVLYKYSSK